MFIMKKLLVLAVSAILAANISAQEAKAQKSECKKEQKEQKFSKEERVERDIKILSEELYLSEEQAEKFAVTYREYIAAKEKLNEEFKAKFGETLNERQVREVLHFRGPRPKGGEFKHNGDLQRVEKSKDGEGPRKEFKEKDGKKIKEHK